MGAVSGNWDVGGLVGSNSNWWGSEGIVTGCFWDTQTSGQAKSYGGTGKTTAEMQTANTFLNAGWDFVDETKNGTDDIWTICERQDYPKFIWQFVLGDFNADYKVDSDDFALLSIQWRTAASSFFWCRGADLENDGLVDFEDLMILAESWLME